MSVREEARNINCTLKEVICFHVFKGCCQSLCSSETNSKQVFQESECDLNSIWLHMRTFSEYDISTAFLYKASLGRVLPDRGFTVKAGWKKVTEEGTPSRFSAVNMEAAVRIRLDTHEILPSALFPQDPFPTGVKRALTLAGESRAAAASGLSWQPRGYGHGLWTLTHTAWRLGLWLILYHQLTVALCQRFFQFRDHGK